MESSLLTRASLDHVAPSDQESPNTGYGPENPGGSVKQSAHLVNCPNFRGHLQNEWPVTVRLIQVYSPNAFNLLSDTTSM